MRTKTQGSCLALVAFICFLAARPCAAQPDCTALNHDPLPVLTDSAESAKRLTDCAYLLTNRGDYRRAQTLFEKALEMSARRADPASRAIALAGMGLTLGTLGEADRAEKMLVESFQISEELNDRDGMAEASSQLGHLRSQVGNYEEARTFHLRSFTLWESIGDHKGMAVALNNVGAAYRAVGDNTTALEYFQRSFDELDRMGDRRRSATVIDNIGRIYRTLGDYGQGLELARKALAIRESLDDREGMSRSLNSLSESYRAQGNYAAALDALRRSLDLRNAIGYVLAVAEAQNNLAVVYEAQGDYPQAIAYLRKSLALNAAKVHSESLAAEIHTHLGEIYSRQGMHARAVLSLRRALAAGTKAGLTLQTADARLALARAYLDLGQLGAAEQQLQTVLQFRTTTGDRSGRAEALIELAEIARRRGRAAQGLTLATEARDMADAMEIPDVRWLAATAVGRMNVALERTEEARAAFEGAIQIVEDMRVLNAAGEEGQSRFFANRQAPYQERIALALAASNTDDAFSFAERSKARVLLDVIRGDRIPITKAMTDAERRREVELRTQLTSVNSELLFAAAATPRDEARVAALQRKRAARRLAYEELQAQLYAAHPELRVSRADVPSITARDAQQLLSGAGEAIVEFVAGPKRMHAFVISTAGVRAFELTAGTAAIELQIQQFRDRLANRDLRVSESSRRLYEMVLGPLQPVLAGKSSLIIVPDGVLWNLPFQALQQRDGRYLIERAAISYAPSATVLRETMRPRPERPPATALLAFGNPATAGSDARRLPLATRGGFAPLPETEREVHALASIYGPSSRVYVGAEAREDRWNAEAASARVVHLATHGVLDNASPLYSHLVLARPERGATDDGLLEAWEIMNTQLRADLVVLSACETARGRVAAGEGVIGLMWAVFVAGAPATLVTQWPVDAASSTALMVEFHRAWNVGSGRTSKARALQQASLKVLHTRGFSHPFYWAGFILAGDGR
jgi:CHAT domain-containing protein/lipopolysaccharide biosynthesis regulator YciM